MNAIFWDNYSYRFIIYIQKSYKYNHLTTSGIQNRNNKTIKKIIINKSRIIEIHCVSDSLPFLYEPIESELYIYFL